MGDTLLVVAVKGIALNQVVNHVVGSAALAVAEVAAVREVQVVAVADKVGGGGAPKTGAQIRDPESQPHVRRTCESKALRRKQQ